MAATTTTTAAAAAAPAPAASSFSRVAPLAALGIAALGGVIAMGSVADQQRRGTLFSAVAPTWWSIGLQLAGVAFAAYVAQNPRLPRAPAVAALAFASYPLSNRAQDSILGAGPIATPATTAAGVGFVMAAIGDYLAIMLLGTKRQRDGGVGFVLTWRWFLALLSTLLAGGGLLIAMGGSTAMAVRNKTVTFLLWDMLLQGSAVMTAFGALIPSKWIKGHRSDLAAIGLMACSTVSMLRNAQPPYLNDAVGALRAGSAFAAAGNMCVMATMGWREGYAYGNNGGGASSSSGGVASAKVASASSASPSSAPRSAASRLSILARAAGGAGLAVAVAGLGTSLAGAHQVSEKRINKFMDKTTDQKAAPYLRLLVHIFALGFSAAVASRTTWLRRARMGAVGMLATAAAFAANDVEAFYAPGGWRKANMFLFAGLLLLAIGEVGAFLGLGFARDGVATAEAVGEEGGEAPSGAFVAGKV